MPWNDDLENGSPAFILASSTASTIRAVAGPGSGKSFALKRRIARLLEAGMDPERILAITFTRASAQDLRREITSIGIPGAELVHSRTLHSHALKILMKTDVLSRTKRTPRMIIDHEIEPALRDINDVKYGDVSNKKKLIKNYTAAWATLQTDTPGFTKNEIDSHYETDLINWLLIHGGILVGEVIPIAIEFLRNNPGFSEIGAYQAILVDEYQDLNRSEQEFIRLIRGDTNIVIVGDDDQSIYGFKYAYPAGIRELEKLHGSYQDIPFNECRRCPTQITAMASSLISVNPNRTLGPLVPHSKNHDGIIQIVQWKTYSDEIEGISLIVIKEIESGAIKPEDVLILCPRRRIGYKLRDNLIAAGLPVKSYFRESAISKESVKRAYSLLNLLANPNDSISLRFLLGIGSTDFRRNQYEILRGLANEKKLTLIETLHQILQEKIGSKGLKTILAEFRKVIGDSTLLKKEILISPEDGFQTTFIKTEEDEIEFYELNQLYKNAVNEIGTEELLDPNNFESWIQKVFGNLQENITLPESPNDIDHIRIMSLHSSKGLSAKFVILCSMIDHLIPFITPEEFESGDYDGTLQEQRRLFYVAITRCKASNDYPGRLLISSFLSILGVDALRMGLSASANGSLSVSATRFIRDFGTTSPTPIRGETLLE